MIDPGMFVVYVLAIVGVGFLLRDARDAWRAWCKGFPWFP